MFRRKDVKIFSVPDWSDTTTKTYDLTTVTGREQVPINLDEIKDICFIYVRANNKYYRLISDTTNGTTRTLVFNGDNKITITKTTTTMTVVFSAGEGYEYGETDTTLTLSDVAADAKATGDAINEVKDDLKNVFAYSPLLKSSDFEWTVGKTVSSNGTVSSTLATAITNIIPVNGGEVIVNTSNAIGMNNKETIFHVNQYINEVWQSRTILANGRTLALANNTNGIRLTFGYAVAAGNTETQEDIDANFSARIVAVSATQEYAEKIENDFLIYVQHGGEYEELEFTTGTIINTGAVNTTAVARIRCTATMPQIKEGDFFISDAPYKIRVFVYSNNALTTGNFVAYLNADFVSGAVFIPKEYVGKYAGVCICKEGYESSDISADVPTISQYVRYYQPSNSDGIVQNIYQNTYNITSSPTITTDTNGWLASTDDQTDRTSDIMTMLNDTGYCHLGEGVFYVSGNIDLPENTCIEGCGNATIVRLLDSATNAYVFKVQRHNIIKNLCIKGSDSTITSWSESIGTRHGIYYTANYDGQEGATSSTGVGCRLNNLSIQNFTGYGIFTHNTGLSPYQGISISQVWVYACHTGLYFDYRSEYNKIVNAIITRCYIACRNDSGNNGFENCTFHATYAGFIMDNTNDDKPNNAHGYAVGCTFCHIGNNVGIAILIKSITGGFIFSDLQVHYNSIELYDSEGIQFNNVQFGRGVPNTGGGTIKVDGGALIVFNGCVFMHDDERTPNISITDNTKVKFVNCYGSATGNTITGQS